MTSLLHTRAFKRHLDHIALPPAARAQTFSRLEDYRVHLLNRLGQLKDSFPAKIVKGLAFSPLTDIRSFVHNYLLDENLLDVKNLQEQLDTLRHFEALAANVRERLEALNRIDEFDKERAATRRRRITNGYIARLGNPEWKRISTEEVLRELNLVANPNYIHLSGNWQITIGNGKILDLNGFTPSIGFPAAQISTLQSVRAESVLCIENLTTFYQYTQMENATRTMKQAVLCTYGNPSPSIRRILRLLPQTTHISLWSDMDYGGFHILAQLRKQVSPCIQPYLMDIATFDNHAHLSRPLSQNDIHNLKRLARNPALDDVRATIQHLLQRGLKLEQEAIQI